MSDSKSKSVKRKKNFYVNNFSKKGRYETLNIGTKGFICTFNGDPKFCIREAYDLLDEYSEKLKKDQENETQENKKLTDDEELKKELEELRAGGKKFQALETGVNGCIFIRSEELDPYDLSLAICNDIIEKKVTKARRILRMIPVEVTCKAYFEDIKKTADSIFDKHFKCDPTTYAIIINKRNNNSVLKEELIGALGLLVQDRSVHHRADLKAPRLAIVVEIMKGVCCLSVLPAYYAFAKYNLQQMAKPPQSAQGKPLQTDPPAHPDQSQTAGEDQPDQSSQTAGADTTAQPDQSSQTAGADTTAQPDQSSQTAGADTTAQPDQSSQTSVDQPVSSEQPVKS